MVKAYRSEFNSNDASSERLKKINAAHTYLKGLDYRDNGTRNTGSSYGGSGFGAGNGSRRDDHSTWTGDSAFGKRQNSGGSQYGGNDHRHSGYGNSGYDNSSYGYSGYDRSAGLYPGMKIIIPILNSWMSVTIDRVFSDGTVSVPLFDRIESFSRPVPSSPLLYKWVLINEKGVLQARTVSEVYQNGVVGVFDEPTRHMSYLSGPYYRASVSNHPLMGKTVRIKKVGKDFSEKVIAVFDGGTVLTTSNNVYTREHYKTEVAGSKLVGRRILIPGPQGKFSVDTVTSEHEDGWVETAANAGFFLKDKKIFLDIPDSDLRGSKVLIRVTGGARIDSVQDHFGNGHILTSSGQLLPPSGYASSKRNSDLVNRFVLIYDSFGKKRCERIVREYEDGSLSTDRTDVVANQSYTLDVPQHELVGKVVEVRNTQGKQRRTVMRAFEDGNLQIDEGDFAGPRTYELAPKIPEAGEIVLVRLSANNFRPEPVRSSNQHTGEVTTESGTFSMAQYMEIAPTDWGGRVVARDAGGGQWVRDEILMVLRTGEVLTKSNVLVPSGQYRLARPSEHQGKMAKVSAGWFRTKNEEIIAVLTDGAILTNSGIFNAGKYRILESAEGPRSPGEGQALDSLDVEQRAQSCRALFDK